MAKYLFLLILIWNFPVCAEDIELWADGEKPLSHFKAPTVKEINLAMAGNEFEIVIFRLPKIAQKNLLLLDNVQLKFEGNDPKIKFTLSSLATHELMNSSFAQFKRTGIVPDIVIPQSLLHEKGFAILSDNTPKIPHYLIEFFTPASTMPGTYKGTFQFSLQKKDYSIPFSLTVYPTVLPQRFDLKTSFGFAPWPVLKKHYGDWNAEEIALYTKYFEMATDHRIDLHKLYHRFPKLDKKTAADIFTLDEGGKSYLQAWNPLYQGTDSILAFKWGMTDLPVPEEYKHDVDTKALDYWKALNLSAKKNNLLDKTFVYFVDEPKKEQLPKIKRDLAKVKIAAPNLKYLITNHHDPVLKDLVDIWCVNYTQWDKPGFPSPRFYHNELSKSNQKFWLYVSCNAHGCDGIEDHTEPDLAMDRPSSYARTFPIMAFYDSAQGILYYDTVYGYTKEGNSPWHDQFNFTGYGEGNLFYPCNKTFCGVNQQFPLASLRLKVLRDGLEDVQIYNEGKKKGVYVMKDLRLMIKGPRQFPLNNSEYNQFKIKILEELKKKK